jgi:hypothetical protein
VVYGISIGIRRRIDALKLLGLKQEHDRRHGRGRVPPPPPTPAQRAGGDTDDSFRPNSLKDAAPAHGAGPVTSAMELVNAAYAFRIY